MQQVHAQSPPIGAASKPALSDARVKLDALPMACDRPTGRDTCLILSWGFSCVVKKI